MENKVKGFMVIEGGGNDLTIADVLTIFYKTREEAISYVKEKAQFFLEQYGFIPIIRERIECYLANPVDMFHVHGMCYEYEIRAVIYED